MTKLTGKYSNAEERYTQYIESIGWRLLQPWVKASAFHLVECPSGHEQRKQPSQWKAWKCKECAALLKESQLDKEYHKAIVLCENNDLVPLFARSSWKKLGTGSHYYPVKCKKCGSEYQTQFNWTLQNVGRCPFCSEGRVNGNRTRYLHVLKELASHNMKPLFTEQEWKEKGSYTEFDVECTLCGTVFKTRIPNFYNCPGCTPSKCKNQDNAYLKALKFLEDAGLEPLFSREEFVGTNPQNRDIYKVRCKSCGTEFLSRVTIAATACPKCFTSNYRSTRERKVQLILEGAGQEVFCNYKPKNMGKREVDIYLPSKGIAFEFNGYYWHKSGKEGKEPTYHKSKTQDFLKAGIKVYHLWEDTSDQLVESIIRAKLGLAHRIYARKCEVVEGRTPNYFKSRHVEGDAPSKWQWSLYFRGRQVAAMSIRIHSSGNPEIARFCCELNTLVVGGYQKLLKHAERFLIEQGYSTLITYCNRDLSPDPTNNIYTRMGFTLVKECPLILKYWTNKDVTIAGKIYKRGVISRQKVQKHKLKELSSFSEDKTEQEILEEVGVYPVYNSGNFRYEKSLI